MNFVQRMKEKVLKNESIDREEALQLSSAELGELCRAADEIRAEFCQNGFDICTIINGKSGKCSENCKYCAQAGCHATSVEEYSLLPTERMLEEARHNAEQGVLRYSIVTSCRKLSHGEVAQVCESIRAIKKKLELQSVHPLGFWRKRISQS